VLANSYTYQWVKRIIHFHARRFEEAASVAEAMAAPVPNAMFYNVMIYAQLGRSAEVDLWRSRLLGEVPNWSAELYFSDGDYEAGPDLISPGPASSSSSADPQGAVQTL
jgi:hypothetical protein